MGLLRLLQFDATLLIAIVSCSGIALLVQRRTTVRGRRCAPPLGLIVGMVGCGRIVLLMPLRRRSGVDGPASSAERRVAETSSTAGRNAGEEKVDEDEEEDEDAEQGPASP